MCMCVGKACYTSWTVLDRNTPVNDYFLRCCAQAGMASVQAVLSEDTEVNEKCAVAIVFHLKDKKCCNMHVTSASVLPTGAREQSKHLRPG